ncbi:MAG: amine dehydrogenase [Proteobacteria bacterium]|nr:amine dehydrogenase [Pseudomonadota bacterium]
MRALPVFCATSLALTQLAYAAGPPPPVPVEHLTVEKMPPRGPHWVYVLDEAFDNEIDARVIPFDGDSNRRLGQIDAGFNPGFNLSPDGNTTVVSTTYFARGGHGARTDVVEFTDNSNLTVKHEVILPSKRAMTGPSLFNVAYSDDAHLLYAAYITPAASFGVIDALHYRMLGEIDTAGCVMTIPGTGYRVSSICENGRLLTVTLDAQGKETGRSMSEPFFNADTDPVFVQGIAGSSAHKYIFLSFLGQVHQVDFNGAQPVFAPAWSLVSPAEQGKWRPGGTQMGAVHRGLNRLYVQMHQGGEGSHKEGGSEIWVFDLASHKRIARWPVHAHGGIAPIQALQVTQDNAPLLFAATDAADLAVLDARSGQIKHVEKHLGQTPWMLLTP